MANVGDIQRTFDSSKSRNEHYWVRIKCSPMKVEIIADMPEETQTAVGSEWEGLLPASLGQAGNIGNLLEAVGKGAFGSGVQAQNLTQQIWVNSSPMEIPITLQFDAENDAFNDVYAPMRLLEMMAMPREWGGFLYSPGTNSGFGFGGDSGISVHIGRYLHVPRAIIVNVSSSFNSRLDAKGYPISGRSDLTIRTDRVLSAGNWAEMTGVN